MGHPPVLLLGVDTQIGLTVVRELGERGVPVYGIARSRAAVGLRSRHLCQGYVTGETPQDLRDLIGETARRHGIQLVMAVSERDIFWLNAERDAWPGLRLLVPSAERMVRVVDKSQTYTAARAAGIAVPEMWQAARVEDVEDIARAARYPVVLKWADPVEIGPRLMEAGLPLRKVEFCHEAADLGRALGRYAGIGRFPLVQSYCPGHGIGQMVFMYGGRPLLRFQHRRLREWPPEGGIATAAISVPLTERAEQFEKTVHLLRRLDWEGAAMVEYRLDPATGAAALMEINGRFWGSQPLAYHSGAHFAWYTYSVLGLGQIPEATAYRAGLRCRFLIPDTSRLFTVLFRPRSVQDRQWRRRPWQELCEYVLDFVRPEQRYFVFSWKDPMPAIADLGGVLVEALTGVARALRAAGLRALGSAQRQA